MIEFLNEHGYSIWVILLLLILWVFIRKARVEPLTKQEQRKHSFLMERTESKWGTD